MLPPPYDKRRAAMERLADLLIDAGYLADVDLLFAEDPDLLELLDDPEFLAYLMFEAPGPAAVSELVELTAADDETG